MGDKVKLVPPEAGFKDDDVIINVENEGENGAVELKAVRTNKGRAAAENTYDFVQCIFFFKSKFGFIWRDGLFGVMLAKQRVN